MRARAPSGRRRALPWAMTIPRLNQPEYELDPRAPGRRWERASVQKHDELPLPFVGCPKALIGEDPDDFSESPGSKCEIDSA